MQIVVGAVLLVNAALVASGVGGKRGDGSAGIAEGRFGPLAMRTRQLLNGRSLWTAGVAGLGIALPSVDYLAVLALIVASGAAAAVQVGALLMFNVVAFGFVEIPLIAYLVAPDRTRATLSALQRLAADAAPTRGHRPVGGDRLRAARRGACRTLAARVVQHVLGTGEELRNRIGAAAEGGLRRRCGDGRRVIAMHRIHRDRSGQRIVVS